MNDGGRKIEHHEMETAVGVISGTGTGRNLTQQYKFYHTRNKKNRQSQRPCQMFFICNNYEIVLFRV
jgi:hypothetical protein